MTIRTDRLSESIRNIAITEILEFSRDHENSYGIISVLEVIISNDKGYADLMVHSQWDDKELIRFLSPIAWIIHSKISRELWLRRTPHIRFRIAKNTNEKTDILSIINQLDKQYGLSK
jgi:ribosome-binding factor A